jgi:hypothetical protein
MATAASNAQAWEVTDELAPVKMKGTFNNGQWSFTNGAENLKEYVAFAGTFLTPQAIGKVAPQNLHGTAETDYFIITHPLFVAQAERLALFHQQKNGLRTLVVTTEQVFNEFGGGQGDPSAIRDFVKMYYDKYRATWDEKGKYLLLFAKASFDYKARVQNNTNYVPSYQSATTLDPLGTYTSDDYFGFLDDAENINSSLIMNALDIGIGRVPVRTCRMLKPLLLPHIPRHPNSTNTKFT